MNRRYFKILILVSIIFLAFALRVYKLDQVPHSLFGDEVDVGYQAYSIWNTGKDLSGRFLPIYLRSLSEYRASLYIYSSVPFVGVFGLNEWGIRLPAVFWGIFSIAGLFLITRKLFSTKVALISAFLLAISPWHLQYSRGSFEVTMLLSFIHFGVYFFLQSFKKPYFLLLSAFLFGLTVYIYSTAVIFSPLIILALLLIYGKEFIHIKKLWIGLSFLLISIIVVPSFLSIFSGEATNRFSGISIFTDSVLLDKINLARQNLGYYTPEGEFRSNDPATETIYHNKPTVYLQVFATNYLKALSLNFLFAEGDINFRHHIHEMGELYYFELILLAMGLWYLFFKSGRSEKLLVLTWVLIAPIPGSLTADGGYHATRLFVMLPPLVMLNALGLANILGKYKRWWAKVILGLLGVLFAFNLTFYLHRYYEHYPVESWRWWHTGYKEAMQFVRQEEGKYEKVFFNNTYEPTLIRFLTWNQVPPSKIQSEFGNMQTKNNIVEGFNGFVFDNKYYFGSTDKQYGVIEFIKPGYLYMVAARDEVQGDWDWSKTPPGGIKVLKTIYNPQNQPIFYVVVKE
jgi:4-amino-4-deoxy-L-arabinose transferase-like glycosyltransferase